MPACGSYGLRFCQLDLLILWRLSTFHSSLRQRLWALVMTDRKKSTYTQQLSNRQHVAVKLLSTYWTALQMPSNEDRKKFITERKKHFVMYVLHAPRPTFHNSLSSLSTVQFPGLVLLFCGCHILQGSGMTDVLQGSCFCCCLQIPHRIHNGIILFCVLSNRGCSGRGQRGVHYLPG